MDDREAHEFYANPANLRAVGSGRRRSGSRLTTMLPVRFRPEVIEAVKNIASEEGITASAWIRRAAQRALERPHDLVPGSGRAGTPRAVPSSLSLGAPRAFSCPHMSIGNVARASCGICGPMRAA